MAAGYPYRVPNPLTAPWLMGHPLYRRTHPQAVANVPGLNVPSAAPVSPPNAPRPMGQGVGATAAPTPSTPPLGSYDPNLDASERNAQLGLADLLQNQGITAGQQQTDYKLQRQQGRQQYGNRLQDIQKQFHDMAVRQTEAANVMGVEEGGTPHHSAHIRNQLENTAESRLKQAFQQQQQSQALQLQRARQAQAMQAAHAKRDYAFYSQDIANSKWWQAFSSGMLG